MDYDFYLASRSPRRMQLLRDAGYRFECVPANLPELVHNGESPADFARRMALDKAGAASGLNACALGPLPVLGADTDVSVDGQILGKPRDQQDAVNMLLRLSNRRHEVHTAVAVRRGTEQALEATCTEVVFGRITRAEAEAYWDTGEPVDKAGAYAIQGLAGRWVREIRGSYSGVVGLPVYETMALLRRFGVEPVMPR